jgi:purine-binding chemotaxis protein CheW
MIRNPQTFDAEAIQRILQERAEVLGRSSAEVVAVKTVSLVELVIGSERFGVNLQQVHEVQPLRGLTPVPGIGSHWAGVVNLRGRLYPVLDLRPILGLDAAAPPAEGQIIVVSAAGLEVALWAADGLGVRHVPQEDIQPIPLETGTARMIVTGVTADLLTVLDLEVLLSDPGLIVQEEIK